MSGDSENILDDLIGRVARVRSWLMAMGVLKMAAAGLACLCGYIGAYAWIDHHVHFGHAGRLCALLVLLMLLVGLAYVLVRAFKQSITYAYAANYVENRRSFDQQLVAAVEYFERREDYPYSRVLAEQLVLQVDEASRGFRFDSTINKWKGYVLAGLITLGLFVVGLFVQQNVSYFTAYLSRLFRPLAKIEPVPAAVLESVTEDVVVARDDPVTLSAAIEGRTPESASLVLTRGDPNDVNGIVERFEVQPRVDDQGNTILTTTRSFDAPGQLSYQFEADGISSDTHAVKVCEPPAIKSMTATVSLPQGQYTQEIKDGTLEVPPDSTVELQVQSTTPLRDVSATAPGGKPTVKGPDGTSTFSTQFSADAAGSVEFKLTSADGITNREPQQLRIVLKGDEPPRFELLCPESDYLATDVASIPITVKVTDDFGLDASQLYCELPNRAPITLDSKTAGGATEVTLAHTLELEQYDLHIGDSILFYARATDIGTGRKARDANSCSEVYFIEIRPYRQFWHPEEAGKPSSIPGPVPEDLITLLEYTRAALKKTWAFANASSPSREGMDALRGDVEYCDRLLARTRDDPDNHFSESDKAALNRIEERYVDAGGSLQRYDADAALPAMRDAYRLLRQFIDELHLKWTPPQSGPSSPQETPERVKLQEEPPNSQADQQRAENQLQQLQRKIESLARQQKSLSSDVKKTLEQEQAASGGGQSSNSSSPGKSDSEQSSSGAGQDSQRQSAKSTESERQSAAQQTRQGENDANEGGEAQGDNDSGQTGQTDDKQKPAGDPSTSPQAQSRAGDKSSAQQGTPSGRPGVSQDGQRSEAGSSPSQGASASKGDPSQAQSRSGDQQSSSPGNSDAPGRNSAGKAGVAQAQGASASKGNPSQAQSRSGDQPSSSPGSSGAPGRSSAGKAGVAQAQGASASKGNPSQAQGQSGDRQSSPPGDSGAPGRDSTSKAGMARTPGSPKSGDAQSQARGQSGNPQSSPGESREPQDMQTPSAQTGSPAGKESNAPGSSSAAGSESSQSGRPGKARIAGSQGEGRPSTPGDARLRMLEAKQKALREQASQVRDELERLPATEVTAPGRARDEAQKHIAQAVEEMKQSEDRLTGARYESAAQDTAGLSEPADLARRELTEAARAIRKGLSGDKPKSPSDQAQEMAEQLAEDAEALDESLSAADRQRMLERLEAAKRLLQSNPDPQWATISRGGSPTGGLVYTQGGASSPAETARMLARQFWSIAIEARKKELKPFVEPPSDAEFFKAEKEFFERAARFTSPPAKE